MEDKLAEAEGKILELTTESKKHKTASLNAQRTCKKLQQSLTEVEQLHANCKPKHHGQPGQPCYTEAENPPMLHGLYPNMDAFCSLSDENSESTQSKVFQMRPVTIRSAEVLNRGGEVKETRAQIGHIPLDAATLDRLSKEFKHPRMRSPATKTVAPPGPFRHLQVDYITLPKCEGKQDVLVIVDKFSRWIECYPTSKGTAAHTAKMLVQDFIPRWGLPEQIESDQGTHFTGQNHTAETVPPSTQNTAWTSRCLVDSSRNVHLKKICAADWRRGRDLEDDLPSNRRCQVHQDNMNTSQIQTLCMIITMIYGSNA
ncbi:hypothetical protein SRHO_G00147730 [Serrasalmus rhombeus]